MIEFIYFDTETTGLSPQSDRLVELAAINAATGESFVQLINPGRAIPEQATAVHQITDEMVQTAPTFDQIAPDFLSFCTPEKSSTQTVLIAHNNLAFDLPFLKAELGRYQLSLPNNWYFLDTLHWARHYRPDLPRHSLQYLRQIYGIDPNQAHRALDDVVVLRAVFEAMIDDLPLSWVVEKMRQIQPYAC